MALYCPHCGSDTVTRCGRHHDGRQRWRCRMCCRRTLNALKKPPASESQLEATARELREQNSRFVITSAQNDTALYKPFWAALQRYCEDTGAQLLVVRTRYKNPDAFHEGADAGMTWPAETLPYLLDSDIVLHRHLMVMGDVKIAATAVNPLSGLDALSGKRSAIYGHAQVQMRMVATPHAENPRMLHTTGSVSRENYSRSTAGSKGRFHHSLGALVVETRGDKFWVRELMPERSGAFYDLDTHYTPKGVTRGHRVAALVLGDEHCKFMSEDVVRARWGEGGIVPTLRPHKLIRHDIHDHYSQSHHHEGDTILKVEKVHAGDWSVREELEVTRDHLERTTTSECESCIVESNHHDHVRRWLNRFSPERDPHNAVFAWKLQGQIAACIEANRDSDPFRVYLRNNLSPETLARIRFVHPNDRFVVKGIDCSQHGDRGPNGSRPSDAGFARSAYKTFRGHRHTPGIEKGAWTVGVSAPSMPYAKGLSSWMTTDGVIYPNGKRALIHMLGSEWRG